MQRAFRPEASCVQHWSVMRPAKHFYVYIMTNRPRSHVLYTGVTGKLPRRVFEHKNKLVPGFTARYNLTRLVYYELFYFAGAAIEREKQIKGWSRSKKIALITSLNPKWDDLAAGWGDQFKPDHGASPEGLGTAREIPQA